jgi:hypothetical protein
VAVGVPVAECVTVAAGLPPIGVLVGDAVGVAVATGGSTSTSATTSAALMTPSRLTSRPAHVVSPPNSAPSNASKSAWVTLPSQFVSPSNSPAFAADAAPRSAMPSNQTTARRPTGVRAGRPGPRSFGMGSFRHCTA